MFAASMALTFGVTIVIFSPSRRASRSLLERMHDFIKVLDKEGDIVEYNQENLKIVSSEGTTSLLRSFPSKVSVRQLLCFSLYEIQNI